MRSRKQALLCYVTHNHALNETIEAIQSSSDVRHKALTGDDDTDNP